MIGLLALAAVVASVCSVERAQYVLRGMPEITAYYRAVDSGKDWPSQLAMAVHSSKTGETSWWVPWNGGTDGRTNIASTTDATRPDWRPPDPDNGPRPQGNRLFLTADASYNILYSVPKRGEAAPAHLLAPEAGGSQDKIFFERQFFDFVSCLASGG